MSRIGLVVPALVILVACSDGDMSDLRAYVQGVKERKPGPIAPLPELEPIGPLAFAP